MKTCEKVTRTFGDIEAKLTQMGGNPNVVVATPDITCFKVCEEHDFIIIASNFKVCFLILSLINRRWNLR